MKKSKAWMSVRDSFWFVPAIYGLCAVVLVLLMNLADAWLISNVKEDIPKILMTSVDTARKLYGTLVTAILTMTTISFSVIMVVLTTYSSQFSPRVLQDFMKNRFTQHILGIFSSGFIFALLLLLFVDQGKPVFGPISMVVIAIICLGAFVYFIHHSARWLQVNRLSEMIKSTGIKTAQKVFHTSHKYKKYHSWDEQEIDSLEKKSKTTLTTNVSGYIQSIKWQSLVDIAKKNGVTMELHAEVGDFIPSEFPLLTVFNTNEFKSKKQLRSLFIMGKERSDMEDIEFMIQKLVDIALRAKSPSTNDPHTAINCINRIEELLIEIGKAYSETPYLVDVDNNLRVIQKPKPYEAYLYQSFYQIKHYGIDDISIVYAILDTLYKIAIVSDAKIKSKIWEFHYYILDSVEWEKLSHLDQQHLQEVYDRLRRCCK